MLMQKYNDEHGANTVFVEVPEAIKRISSTICREQFKENNYDGIVPSAINKVKEIVEKK